MKNSHAKLLSDIRFYAGVFILFICFPGAVENSPLASLIFLCIAYVLLYPFMENSKARHNRAKCKNGNKKNGKVA